ncbi:MAG: hypothetical protein JOZ68_03650 [Acidimicrobiia bacterium]|nr:hypothetical protein [Acidimicrobiia bacterium]
MSNLLLNADKYSPLGSPVTVNVERVIGDAGDEVRVRVTDCGGGIPKNQQDVVFERFRRLGDHMTRRRGGSGLGLYISRRLVEAMGGRIWVEDPRPDEGATFVFALPASAHAPALRSVDALAG